MVLDLTEGDLVTKQDFESFKQHVDHRFSEVELRLVVKLGFITISTVGLTVAILGWLIQIK